MKNQKDYTVAQHSRIGADWSRHSIGPVEVEFRGWANPQYEVAYRLDYNTRVVLESGRGNLDGIDAFDRWETIALDADNLTVVYED